MRILATTVTVASSIGCTDTQGAARVALLALKIFAGLAVAVLVFFPLMASLAAIRAAVRRALASRDRDR
jgi:hypothetical protein